MTKSVSERKRAERDDFKCKQETIPEKGRELGGSSSSSTSSSSSIWSSSLNKTLKVEDNEVSLAASKKIQAGNLMSYANKLQANAANLMKRNCLGTSFISRRSNRRSETRKEAKGDDRMYLDEFKHEFFEEKADDESAEFTFFSNIKVKDTTKDEKGSKVKAVNVTTISGTNRSLRQSIASRFETSLSNVSSTKDCNDFENKFSLKPFDESIDSKLTKSSPLRRVADSDNVDVATIHDSRFSNEILIPRKDVYEFDEVERLEETSKVVKRKRNCVDKMSSDSIEMTFNKPRKRPKMEFDEENDINYDEICQKKDMQHNEKVGTAAPKKVAEVDVTNNVNKHRKSRKPKLDEKSDLNSERSNETLRKNKLQQKKELEPSTSKKETEIEASTSKKRTEVQVPNKPRIGRKKKLEADEEKPIAKKGTTVLKKKATTKTRAAKYQKEIEAEEIAGFEPSYNNKSRGNFKRNSMENSNIRRENYVRVNLKKKVFSRGHKKFNYKRFKYGQWKQLKREKPFKQCDDFDNDDRQDSSDLSSEITKSVSKPKESLVTSNIVVDDFEDKTPVSFSGHVVADSVCELIDGDFPSDVELEVREALKKFGHSDFRYGQLETIKRVLTGQSTLLIQPTGSGKSLCYLLPAYIYAKRSNAITIVISPLVSLMDDQLAGVPSCLSAACHHTGMTTIQRQKVREAVSAGKVDVLFLSPEALVSGAGSSFGCLPPDMPPIAFVCIDEIHCVSSWSHNFRPSYLRLCRVVRDILGVQCILGLTATATLVTADNIRQHLGVDQDPLSIIKTDVLPDNLHLTISRDNKEEALLNLFKSEPFLNFNSIIVYCIRREQTERLATIIRTCLQKESSEWTAEAYHAGLSALNRRSVQKRFMADKLRVVVATVAFGMGLNKPDVRAVIHFNMPKSIESYVQEIGRAGRDGKPAYCHLFLDLRGGDRQELRRHVYANTVDRSAVKKLLSKIFRPCRCNTLKNIEETLSQESGDSSRSSWKCSGHEVAYVIDDAVEELDMKEEGIDTLLCYLEAHPSRPIKMLNRTYGNCVVFSYGGAKQLTSLVEKCPAIAMAFALKKKKQKTEFAPSNEIEFNLTEVATMLGQETYKLRRQLMKLKWTTEEINGVVKYRKTDFVVDFKGLAFHLKAVGDLSDEERDQLTDYLHKRILLQEKIELGQLDKFHSVLHNLSTAQYDSKNELNEPRSRQLKETIRCHFEESSVPSIDAIESWTNSIALESIDKVDLICNNIRCFLGIHSDTQFTGRAIARIFHGIESPRYPAKVWGRARQFWRCLLDVDFNTLCKLATREILK